MNIDIERLKLNIEKTAQQDISENNIFGSAYFVRQKNIVYQKCFGVVNPDNGHPVNETTLFRIASMTKPVTAVAILQLVDRGLISLNDPVKKFLPQFEDIHITAADGQDLGKAKTDMTVLHLLTHTSGIGDSKSSKMTEKDKKTVGNTIDFFAKAGLDFEPFTKQVYSGTSAFDILVAIAENVTGEDFEEFLKREIFKPCGMIDTTFSPSAHQMSRIIFMHDKVQGKSVVGKTVDNCIFEDYPLGHNLGGAGLVSSLLDYSRFATMLLNNGKTESGEIISEKTLKLISVPYVRTEELPGNYNRGLSVRVITENEKSVLPTGSYGWSGAYGTHFWIDPENKIAGVYMKNSRVDGGSMAKTASDFETAVYDAIIR